MARRSAPAIGLFRRLAQKVASPAIARRRRSCRPELVPLEGRLLLDAQPADSITVTATAKPVFLIPPRGQFLPVVVSGTVKNLRPVTPTANYQVIDEYRRDQPRGPVALVPAGQETYNYSFVVYLQAKRANEYPQGRHYYITVAASDTDTASFKTIPVVVPLNPAQIPQDLLNQQFRMKEENLPIPGVVPHKHGPGRPIPGYLLAHGVVPPAAQAAQSRAAATQATTPSKASSKPKSSSNKSSSSSSSNPIQNFLTNIGL